MRISILTIALVSIAAHRAPAFAQEVFASPHATFSPAPVYPESAKSAGIEGLVAVQLHIDAAGVVTEAKALSGPASLQDSALQTAKTWRFEPTIIAGKATPVTATVNMTFGNPPPPTTRPAAPPPAGVLGGVLSGISTPPTPLANGSPLPIPQRPLGIAATTDGDKVVGRQVFRLVFGNTRARGNDAARSNNVRHRCKPFPTAAPADTRR